MEDTSQLSKQNGGMEENVRECSVGLIESSTCLFSVVISIDRQNW